MNITEIYEYSLAIISVQSCGNVLAMFAAASPKVSYAYSL